MIDIVDANDGGLQTLDTQTVRAANILSVQIRSLEYAPEVGIDLDYFLSENIRFQDESFRAYLVERLAFFGINVSQVLDDQKSLFTDLIVQVSPAEESTGLIAR